MVECNVQNIAELLAEKHNERGRAHPAVELLEIHQERIFSHQFDSDLFVDLDDYR